MPVGMPAEEVDHPGRCRRDYGIIEPRRAWIGGLSFHAADGDAVIHFIDQLGLDYGNISASATTPSSSSAGNFGAVLVGSRTYLLGRRVPYLTRVAAQTCPHTAPTLDVTVYTPRCRIQMR